MEEATDLCFSSSAAVCVQAPPVYRGFGPEPEVPWLAYHVQDHAGSSQGYPSAQVSDEREFCFVVKYEDPNQ